MARARSIRLLVEPGTEVADAPARPSAADRDSPFADAPRCAAAPGTARGKDQCRRRLVVLATTLWEDYQAAAFQAVAELKGDDQTQRVDVLRQVNSRYSDDLRPALQAVIDGRTPTGDESGPWSVSARRLSP